MIKARDLRVNIAQMGFERGVVHTLELALEELSAHREALRDAATLLSEITENMQRFLTISSGMQTKMDQLRRNQESQQDGEP